MMIKYSSKKLLLLIIALRGCCDVISLAISSSKSQQPKKRMSNDPKTGAGGGFGKASSPQQRDATQIYTPDTSPETLALLSFLVSQKSKGLGVDATPDAGTEIGFSKIGNNDNIRGVYATKSFKRGDILCQVPSDCALALSDPAMGGTDVPNVAHGGRNFLRFYKSNPVNSQTWAFYLNTLPTPRDYFDPTPDFYSPEEIEALEFPRAIGEAHQRQEQIADLADAENIDLEELQFAAWIVSSRSFKISIQATDDNGGKERGGPVPKGAVSKPNKKEIRVLIPYLDMINHSSDNPNAELHLIDPEKDDAWFAVRATRPIRPGKEITIAYGSGVDSSVELLLNYGFVPNENRIDSLMLKKGGDGVIETLDGWKTTLEEDMEAYDKATGNMKNVLALRIKLKKAYA